MGSIRLNTSFRRITEAGSVFADVGETLIVGEEISADDAAKLLGRDPPGAEIVPEPEAPTELPAKGKPGR